jgi:diacylglycerol O-acyltransferase
VAGHGTRKRPKLLLAAASEEFAGHGLTGARRPAKSGSVTLAGNSGGGRLSGSTRSMSPALVRRTTTTESNEDQRGSALYALWALSERKSIWLLSTGGVKKAGRVRRLTGLDASYLSVELPEQPVNIMALALLRPPSDVGGAPVPLTLDDVRRHVARRLNEVPEFRLVVKHVPFGLRHPVLVDACTFDLDDHLAYAVLPAPGGDAEIDGLYGHLAEQHLDRRRPLWRLTLVDGLADCRQALVLQVQHCLMDGTGIAGALGRIFTAGDHDPDAGTGWHPERPPGWLRLLVGGAVRQIRMLGRIPGLLNRTGRAAAAVKARASQSGITVPQQGAGPPVCLINRGLSAQRRFAHMTVDLADVRVVKESAEATVNDVVLAMVAGSLRRYLVARNDLPEEPLVANVPVSMDGPGASGRVSGNRVSRLLTTLATDVADPWERLTVIHEVTRESKTRLHLAGPDLLNDWLEILPPFTIKSVVRLSQRRRQQGRDWLDANVVVSNMRGPAEPWMFGSAVAEELYMTGPPFAGMGIVILLWDYAGKLRFGILSTADSIDDSAELVEGLRASLRELVAISRRA